jgi:hypothetical protein
MIAKNGRALPCGSTLLSCGKEGQARGDSLPDFSRLAFFLRIHFKN